MTNKALTSEDITKLYEKARDSKRGEYMFWKVGSGANSLLTLTHAIKYVNTIYKKDPDAYKDDHWVYYPELRIAGKLSDIINALADAGYDEVEVGVFSEWATQLGLELGVSGTISIEELEDACIDPMKVEHDEFLQLFTTEHKPVVESKVDREFFDMMLKVGNALKSIKMNKEGRVKVESVNRPSKNKNVSANSKRIQVENVRELMDAYNDEVEPDRWIDVSKFDPETFTGSRKMVPLKDVAKSKKIFPNLDGVPIYIVCDSEKPDILKRYIELIVGVEYPDAVPVLISSIKMRMNRDLELLVNNFERLYGAESDKWIDVSNFDVDRLKGARNIAPIINLDKTDKRYPTLNDEPFYLVSKDYERFVDYVNTVVSVNHDDIVDELLDTFPQELEME